MPSLPYDFRPYRPSDYDWVVACEVALQEHERLISDTRGPSLPHTHEHLKELFEKLDTQHGILLIAEADGRPVGLIAGHVVDAPWPMEMPDSTRYAYVDDMFIEAEHRGTGLAAALLDRLAQHFRSLDQGLTRMRINALADNAPAVKAYQKAGFKPYEVMFERPLA